MGFLRAFYSNFHNSLHFFIYSSRKKNNPRICAYWTGVVTEVTEVFLCLEAHCFMTVQLSAPFHYTEKGLPATIKDHLI